MLECGGDPASSKMERRSTAKSWRRKPVARDHIVASMLFVDGLGYHDCVLFDSRPAASRHAEQEAKRLQSDMVFGAAPYSVCVVAPVAGPVVVDVDLHAGLEVDDGEKMVHLFRDVVGRDSWLAADPGRVLVGGATRLV